ncbi:hypothetical protein HanIR_Chr16g0819031 [Helianthus annuus]|nr:hypothetical protein HanIR_Chr16g0819031 [Helianthus annuus]
MNVSISVYDDGYFITNVILPTILFFVLIRNIINKVGSPPLTVFAAATVVVVHVVVVLIYPMRHRLFDDFGLIL